MQLLFGITGQIGQAQLAHSDGNRGERDHLEHVRSPCYPHWRIWVGAERGVCVCMGGVVFLKNSDICGSTDWYFKKNLIFVVVVLVLVLGANLPNLQQSYTPIQIYITTIHFSEKILVPTIQIFITVIHFSNKR